MKKILSIVAIIVVPSLFFGTALGLLSGDWLVSYLVWPGALVFTAFLLGMLLGIFRFLDWAFDE